MRVAWRMNPSNAAGRAGDHARYTGFVGRQCQGRTASPASRNLSRRLPRGSHGSRACPTRCYCRIGPRAAHRPTGCESRHQRIGSALLEWASGRPDKRAPPTVSASLHFSTPAGRSGARAMRAGWTIGVAGRVRRGRDAVLRRPFRVLSHAGATAYAGGPPGTRGSNDTALTSAHTDWPVCRPRRSTDSRVMRARRRCAGAPASASSTSA